MIWILACTGDADTAVGTTVEEEVHPLLQDGVVFNVAHRGGAKLWPEHTLTAYAGAITAGSEVLELDLHTTSDGVVVMMHDDTVDRTTDGTGAVHDHTFDEIRSLDAGYHFTTDSGKTYPYRGKGLTVPTLDEVLAAHPDALYNIELKQAIPSMVGETLAILEAAGVMEQAVLGSFDFNTVDEIRAAAPDALTNMTIDEVFELYLLEDEDDAAGYTPPTPICAVPLDFSGIKLDPDTIGFAHIAGVKVHVFTINDPDEMRQVIDLGADGVITDDPVTLAAILAE